MSRVESPSLTLTLRVGLETISSELTPEAAVVHRLFSSKSCHAELSSATTYAIPLRNGSPGCCTRIVSPQI